MNSTLQPQVKYLYIKPLPVLRLRLAYGDAPTVELQEVDYFQQHVRHLAWFVDGTSHPHISTFILNHNQGSTLRDLSRLAPDGISDLMTAAEARCHLLIEMRKTVTGSFAGYNLIRKQRDDNTFFWEVPKLGRSSPSLAELLTAFGRFGQTRGRIVVELPSVGTSRIIVRPTLHELSLLRLAHAFPTDTLLTHFPVWRSHGMSYAQLAALQRLLVGPDGKLSLHDYLNESNCLVLVDPNAEVSFVPPFFQVAQCLPKALQAFPVCTEITPDGNQREGQLLYHSFIPTDCARSLQSYPVRKLWRWLNRPSAGLQGRLPLYALDEGKTPTAQIGEVAQSERIRHQPD
jgi:hypothetical protein